MRFPRGLLLCATSALFSNAALAQSQTSQIDPKLAISLAKFGTTLVIGSAQQVSGSWTGRADSISPDQLQSDIARLTESYQSSVRSAMFASSMTQSTGDVIITSAQVLATSSGVGALPAAAVASVARYGNEQFADFLANDGKQIALRALNEGLRDLSKDQQKAFLENLNKGKSDAAASIFLKQTNILSKLETQLADTPDGAKLARDYLTQTIAKGTSDAIREAGKAVAGVTDIKNALADHIKLSSQFAKTVARKVYELSEQSKDLKRQIDGVSQDIDDLRSDERATSLQVSIIQQVMFDQQPPDVKLAMLNAGAMPGLTADQKKKLENVLKVEVKKQEITSTAADVVSIANDVNTIATNLGIHDRTLSDAVRFGNVANTALSQAFSGNYLGAIASITGLFGGARTDPVQQQFQQVFEVLGKIQEQLGTIIALQKETLRAVEQLSVQLATLEKHMNERLDNIEFELKTVSDQTRQILWSQYDSCRSTYNDLQKARPTFDFNDSEMRFESLAGLRRFVDTWYGDAFPCANSLRSLFSKISTTAEFGSPLKIEFAASKLPETPPPGEERTYVKQDLQRFLDDVHAPSAALVLSSWKRHRGLRASWGNGAGAFALLATPAPTTVELKNRIELLDGKQGKAFTACSSPSILSQRSKELLCSPQLSGQAAEAQADSRATVFLQEAILRNQVSDIVRWAAATAPASEFAPGGSATQPPLTLEALAKNTSETGFSYGRDLLQGALMLADVSIAQQAMVYGDLTAYFVFEELWDEQSGGLRAPETADQKLAMKLLRNPNNPWLLSNVALLILEAAEKQCNGVPCAGSDLRYLLSVKPFYDIDGQTGNYNAVTPLKRDAVARLMHANFNLAADASFEEADRAPSGAPIPRKVVLKLSGVTLPLPTAADWAKKRFIYPEGMLDRVRERNILAERLGDYAVFDGLSDDAKARVVNVFARAVP